MPPSLVTIPNVPLVEVGYKWPAMNGPVTFTREDLVDAVAAANNDPTLPSPRLKLTYSEDTHGDAITEPCFGRVTNMRFDEDEQTVYGDFEGVPAWLAEVLPAAYPSRSVEIVHGVKTASGGTWQAVITAVQLLGVEWPGCMSLEDLPLYYGDKKPKDVVLKLGTAMVKGGEQLSRSLMSVNVDDVRRAYYELLESEGNYSWWCKAVLLEPDQLVVEDEWEGELYLVDFTIGDDDEISFGKPKEVKVKYVPVPKTKTEKSNAASYLVAGIEQAGRKVMASYATAEESGRVTRPEGGQSMDEEKRKNLAAKLGLAEDATLEQINSKLQTQALGDTPAGTDPDTEAGNGNGNGTEDDTEDDTDNGDGEETEAGKKPVVSHSAADTVTLDKKAYEELRAGAADGRAARATQLESEDGAFLSAALKEGKFPPARMEHWQSYMKSDREGARTAIEALSPGLIPVEERGTQTPSELAAGGEAYPRGWFPELAAREAKLKHEAEHGHQGVRVYNERVI